MNTWKKVKIGDICKIVKGSTGIASAEPGEYPLVCTSVVRKTCSTFQFDCEAVCIPLVSSSGHGKKSLNYVHYQKGKFALGTILCAVIPNNPQEVSAGYLHQYLQFYKDTALVPLMKGAANVSLSMRDIATVELPLPDFKTQSKLAKMFVEMQNKLKEINAEFVKQKAYAKQLRQNILQEAIEGKLTADLPCRQAGWRKKFKNLSGKIVPKQSCKYFAYVLECDDGSLYKGYSENLYERINRHLDGRGSEWTQKHKPISLIHFEEFDREKEALEREKYFKSGSGREWLNEIRNKNKLDFDADALFEEIQKQRVISSGVEKSKKQKPLPPITDEDLPAGKAGKPFEIPAGWKWVRLGSLGTLSGGKRLPAGESFSESKTDHIYIRIKDMKNGSVELDDLKYISDSIAEKLKRYCIYKDELYITIAGTIGQIGIIPDCLDGMNLTENSAKLKPFIISNVFLSKFLNTDFIQQQFKKAVYGMALPKLAMKRIEEVLISLPPLKEQDEIVNKVEKLLNNVVELEQQISQREEYAKQLMQSVLRTAFAGR